MSVVAIFTPGASRLSPGPKLLPHQFSPSFEVGDFRSSHGVDAPTARTFGMVAGKLMGPLLFPVAMTTTDPLLARPFVRARSNARVITSTGGPPPQEFDSTSAFPSFHAQSIASNSWGGGPPVDVITRAFDRARTKGRANKGSVVVIATGNSNGPINFPATIPNVLAVGASTPWDERKSPTSKDGENWWGSNFGPGLSLLAPGVKIATTDIHGPNGYDAGDYVMTFNGTSSATPQGGAEAALTLAVAPDLREQKVREAIPGSADRLVANGAWEKYVGWGRLNMFSALRRARR